MAVLAPANKKKLKKDSSSTGSNSATCIHLLDKNRFKNNQGKRDEIFTNDTTYPVI